MLNHSANFDFFFFTVSMGQIQQLFQRKEIDSEKGNEDMNVQFMQICVV